MSQYKESRQIVSPSLDRTGRIAESDLTGIGLSGQHTPPGDRWASHRWNQNTGTILSWGDPHVKDYRLRFRDDDYCVDLFPEAESPWKFPNHVFIASGCSRDPMQGGYLVEPTYFDPDPSQPPKGAPMYKIDERTLPEYGIRVAISGGFQVAACAWGPEHNIDAGRELLLAPLDWQGIFRNEIGESWELQNDPSWSYKLWKEHPETQGYDTVGVSGFFPHNPLMPHGDPEPLWNDGLDGERIANNARNRKEGAPLRGSSDKMVALWGDLAQTAHQETALVGGEIAVTNTSAPIAAPAEDQMAGRYPWKDTGYAVRWADPAHFGQVQDQNFPRLMTKCLFCFNAASCKAANNPAKKIGGNPTDGQLQLAIFQNTVGTLGFNRNHFVDFPPEKANPAPLAQIYATSFCMYSTNNPFDLNTTPLRLEGETMASFLRRYDATSDYCHVNGAPRRVVEYDGHYRLLISEIQRPLARRHWNTLVGYHVQGLQAATLDWDGKHQLAISRANNDYQGNALYKAVAPNPYPADFILGQYDWQYNPANTNYHGEEPIVFWYSVRWDPVMKFWMVSKIWAYIWYVSADTPRANRKLVKRLVELKDDYGRYCGNVTEGRTTEALTGGSSDLKSLPMDHWMIPDGQGGTKAQEVWRPRWIKKAGQWIKKDDGIDLVSAYWDSYRDDSKARASGTIQVVAQPGEIIPFAFMAYAPPKMITWGKCQTDQNSQQNLGKTRWHFDPRRGKWVRETGDIDDLYYHLRYDDSRAEGALTSYMEDLPPGYGFFSHFMNPSGNQDHPTNVGEMQVKIADPLMTPSGAAGATDWENFELRDTDLALKSDIQHARNFTAPIFAFDLTTQVPLHHVVQTDVPIEQMDWMRRELEPFDVAAQREYCPTPAIWTFAKNSADREQYYNRRMTETDDETGVEIPLGIERVWMPEGRVWWHRKGILGCMREWSPGAPDFTQTGVAVINLWRRYLPHHMQIVRAYLWLEPVTDPYETDNYYGSGFSPFGSLSIMETDPSPRAAEIRDALSKSTMFADTPGRGWWDYPVPIDTQWKEIQEASWKVLGHWELGGSQPMRWTDPGVSTVGWTEWDLNHTYTHASFQNQYHIARSMRVTINGQPLSSLDKDRPDSFAQRNKAWYDCLGQLYQDGGFAQLDVHGVVENRVYHRNANEYWGLNTRADGGEMADGVPDPLGKAYGYATSGGGRKAPFIFDITSQVRQAYQTRMDVEYQTVVDFNAIPRQHTAFAVASQQQSDARYTLVPLQWVTATPSPIAPQQVLDARAGMSNPFTYMRIGLPSGDSFVVTQINIVPMPAVTQDATFAITYRTKNSLIWRTLYQWSFEGGLTDPAMININRNLQTAPLVCCELAVTVGGSTPGLNIVDIEYIGDIGQVPVTGPTEVMQFTPLNATVLGDYPNQIWSMPMREVPTKIYKVQITPANKPTVELAYGGELPRFAAYLPPEDPKVAQLAGYYFYDPYDNALIIFKTNKGFAGTAVYNDFFTLEVEYVSRAGATAQIAIEALVAGPSHDVDPEAICEVHPDDIARLPQDADTPWGVLNEEELQGGYQYWEPEYKDVVAEESLAKDPSFTDPSQDPAYAGRGTNFVRLGTMPDSFKADETNYRKYWIIDGSQGAPELVDSAWKTKARGYATFYGPPNTIVPRGIRVLAPAYVKYRDPNTQQDMTPNTPQAASLSPRLPNGGMKPAPLILELKMEDNTHRSDSFARKTAAFRPHVLVYMRENTTFLGATNWKELGTGYGTSSEVNGKPYWE